MICDKCNGLEARFHFVKIINGERTESHLCGPCHTDALNSSYFAIPDASNEGGVLGPSFSKVGSTTIINPFHKTPISQELFSSFDAIYDHKQTSFASEGAVCDNCYIAYSEVKQQGVLGCPSCYYAFGDILLPVIQKTQASTEHTGRRPQIGEHSYEAKLEYEKYNTLIREAIAREDFDEAQRLKLKRDNISGGRDYENP